MEEQRVMPHTGMSHVARRNVLSHTYECATAPGERVKLENVWMFHFPHTNTPPLLHERGTMYECKCMNVACPTYEQATPHT